MVSEQAQVILQLGRGSEHMFLTLLLISRGGESGLRPLLTLLSPFLRAAIKQGLSQQSHWVAPQQQHLRSLCSGSSSTVVAHTG